VAVRIPDQEALGELEATQEQIHLGERSEWDGYRTGYEVSLK